jgi:phenylpropionate dioxygenase-like ring-hydroxylating dioxygenase large terminal subunit
VLVCQQPILKRFWYPVMPMAHLADGPKPFRLLNEDIVVWLPEPGVPAALVDSCCHRTAKLSRGHCKGDRLVCGYHGWEYAADGRVMRIPQRGPGEHKPTRMGVQSFHATERYGYVWVALADPLYDVPDFEEGRTPGFRMIQQFYEVWHCGALRFQENSFDNAHFSFVHKGTFGDYENPVPAKLEINTLADGFVMDTDVEVLAPPLQQSLLKINAPRTMRHHNARWYTPFGRKLQFTYPNGLVHSIVSFATPIDDKSSMLCQFIFRNDTEADASTEDILKFDRQVVEEDRSILEATDADVPLEQEGYEYSMPSDKPGVLMRRVLLDLLKAHGEVEVRREGAPKVRTFPEAVEPTKLARAAG